MENFNLALLGKQVWRLLHNTDSLFYKVFKARFFPNCSIMDEGVKLNGSYAWQSIMKARRVVGLGARWRIGNGRKVIIRKDKWLPNQHSSCIFPPQKNFPNNTRVYALIDENNSCWLEDRVRDEFLPHEAASILSLPLSHLGADDKLIWAAKNNGIYSTKTTYQLLNDTTKSTATGPSNRNVQKNFWKKVWSLNVPSKIQHFIWKACIDSLPTKLNLSK